MLQDEIDAAQRRVKTDAYQMSIGEIVNMYKEGEFVINPDFQRLFRWEPGQKSKLIESIPPWNSAASDLCLREGRLDVGTYRRPSACLNYS
jgi:hypothetical protein